MKWIVCHLGAREHYAIPRALHASHHLECLLTDFWVKPNSLLSSIPGLQRLSDRYHSDLSEVDVLAPNVQIFSAEILWRLQNNSFLEKSIQKNHLFQHWVIQQLERMDLPKDLTLFAYSYAANEILQYAKSKGWKTVLGQFDPGPEEERIVAEEFSKYQHLGVSWTPVPEGYWDKWYEEIELADRVMVNSTWSKDCLIKEGLNTAKIDVVPLVFHDSNQSPAPDKPIKQPFQVLFLGQINLRKGVARLLEAMELLKDEAVELILAGPTEIDPSAWQSLPNVKWLGSIPRSRVKSIYQSSDVFILPTLSDGYALTQLEALAFGIPVIASHHCGDVVRENENGWILPNLEASTIAEVIKKAMRERTQLTCLTPPQFTLSDLSNRLLSL